MRLLGRERLDKLDVSNEQVKAWVRSWVAEIQAANWKHPADVQDQFPKAVHENPCDFVFSVGNCNWLVCVLFAFPQGVALITELKIRDGNYGS